MTRVAADTRQVQGVPVSDGGTMTVAEVLALPVLARGLPKVLAGHDRLDRPVRWVHVTEWASPASALRGGELVLTTGLGFPARLDDYAAELADIGAAAVVLELGRCYRETPYELVAGCRSRGVPLVVLHRGVKFVDVTQEVHAMILTGQLRTLRSAQRIHDTFTALSLRGAGADEIVRAAATMTGRAVVLENLAHQALVCAPGELGLEEVLNRWEERSRATPSAAERTGVCGQEGWLVTSVEFRGQRWGRLAMLPDNPAEQQFHSEHVMVLERAAIALTLARLTHESRWEEQAHRDALLDVLERRQLSWRDTRSRITALGVPTHGRRLAVVMVRADDRAGLLDKLRTRLEGSALVGDLGERGVGVLLAFREPGGWRQLAEEIATLAGTAVHVGAEVGELSEVALSAAEAEQVADAVPAGGPRQVYTVSDIGLPELLYSLRDDPRVQAYAERQLAHLLAHDQRHGTDLLATLRHFLGAAGNKSIAARRSHLSRQALYQRLSLIGQILDGDLESGDLRAQLHVAVAALDAQRARRSAGA
ncbi:PucR family transcriptional regulator [Pseudonocardia sp. DSM 110487]|uniref:PucR family transcriptional regulator n=1 Tax=Pseudonocardia sp. DSM 110487 TaxID=2865833 RepID=UPI0021041694|nr:PucR family transcriptional regulator [Pseudonocardia sp. DSM 110487]